MQNKQFKKKKSKGEMDQMVIKFPSGSKNAVIFKNDSIGVLI